MKTGAVTPADLARSVLAVPPLARHADLSLNTVANRALIRHLENGGVSTLMYGGNANFYNVGMYEYASILDFLAGAAGTDTWVIPSAGPDFGKLIDLEMMVMPGGRERTEAEFRSLFERAGFSRMRVVPTQAPLWVVEARS